MKCVAGDLPHNEVSNGGEFEVDSGREYRKTGSKYEKQNSVVSVLGFLKSPESTSVSNVPEDGCT